ncbi:unnamed protein product [Camellia sinensis]
MIYTKEIRPWTHMMEVPLLHGFGPAANHLLEAYKTLLKGVSLDDLEILRVIFGIFPTYCDSPLPVAFDRVLQVFFRPFSRLNQIMAT